MRVAAVSGRVSGPNLTVHSLPLSSFTRSFLAVPDLKRRTKVNSLDKSGDGVRSCLEYARSGDIVKARALSNPDLSPHLSFVDMGGHGYAVVRVTSDSVDAEFVWIPRPLERSDRPDGGPLLYRVRYRAGLWRKGEAPKLEGEVVEGNPQYSV